MSWRTTSSRALVRLAVGAAALATAAAAPAPEVAPVEAGLVTQRVAIVRALQAGGSDYVVGAGLDEPVAVHLSAVAWRATIESVLALAGGGEVDLVDGVVRVTREFPLRAPAGVGRVVRLLRLATGKPAELARIVQRQVLGPAGSVVADEEQKILVVVAAPEQQAEAARLVASLEGTDGGGSAVAQCDCKTSAPPEGKAGASRAAAPGRVTLERPRIAATAAIVDVARQLKLDVVSSPFEGDVSVRLRGVAGRTALDALGAVLGADWTVDGGTLQFGRGRAGPAGERALRVVPVANREPVALAPLVGLVLSRGSNVDFDTAHRRLVMRDLPDALDAAEALLRALDQPPGKAAGKLCWCKPPETAPATR